MNSALNGVKYHAKEPQRFFNRFSFICGALRLLYILCLCLIVAFPLDKSYYMGVYSLCFHRQNIRNFVNVSSVIFGC